MSDKMHFNYVPSIGPVDAKMMIVGEAPGAEEDAIGEPFVGPSGKLLNRVLEEISLFREDIFITNVVKYKPPQ